MEALAAAPQLRPPSQPERDLLKKRKACDCISLLSLMMLPSGSLSWCIHFFSIALFSKLKLGFFMLLNSETCTLTKSTWPWSSYSQHICQKQVIPSKCSTKLRAITMDTSAFQMKNLSLEWDCHWTACCILKAEQLYLSPPDIPPLTPPLSLTYVLSSPPPCFPENKSV